jgi:hypothetical protein
VKVGDLVKCPAFSAGNNSYPGYIGVVVEVGLGYVTVAGRPTGGCDYWGEYQIRPVR